MTDITRRTLLGAAGLGAVGLFGLNIPRLTATDIPGRNADVLNVAILGTNQDAAARQGLVDAFRAQHPEIGVRIQAVQGQDWSNFFAKILTMVAAGNPPDVCVVATEGAQLVADRLAEPLDAYIQRDADVMQDYFSDVHPSLIEAFMYRGQLYQLPIDFNAANIYYNLDTFEKAGLSRPADGWSHDDFLTVARQLRQSNGRPFVPYYWTNRLWGGCVPWLYANDTSFLTESRAPGGEWLWDRFYAADPAAKGRTGGFLWEASNALDPRVEETFDFLRALVAEGLGSSPAQQVDMGLLILNSVLVTAACAIGQMVTAAMAGYVFAKVEFRGRSVLFALILATMMVPMQVTIVPVFMLIRGMGLADTLLALILPAIPTAFGTFLMRQYFMGLPDELSEAAQIDGAGPWRTFFSVFAPLATPGMAIVGILAFNYHWNEFFRPLIMTISEENFTLPLGLVSLQGNMGTGSVATVLAGVVISMIPALVVFIFGQRSLREGLTAGSHR